jgi:hypothetical protein
LDSEVFDVRAESIARRTSECQLCRESGLGLFYAGERVTYDSSWSV